MWWNFMSSSKGRIQRAKQDWSEGRYALVAGDVSRADPVAGRSLSVMKG
jgi:hypothetical protein